MRKTSKSGKSVFDVPKNRRAPPGPIRGPSGARRAPPGPGGPLRAPKRLRCRLCSVYIEEFFYGVLVAEVAADGPGAVEI